MSERATIWGAAGLVAIVSLAIGATVPVRALTLATVDDALFVQLAHNILSGEWLGPYDQTTLVKGAFYPLFLAASSLTNLPLKLNEQIVQLVSSGIAAVMLWRLGLGRRVAFVAFVLLALNPVAWQPDLARVIRENLYSQLGVVTFALAALALLDRHLSAQARLGTLVAWGLSLAAYWLTREESVWLLPSVLALALGAAALAMPAWRSRPIQEWRTSVARCVAGIAAAATGFAVLAGSVALRNWSTYGVFLTNEVREGAMPAAYGALLRVTPDVHTRRTVFQDDVAARVYAVSPAARELEPTLDGERGRGWREIGCRALQLDPCPSGFNNSLFMYALRDAVLATGRLDAAAVQSFYRRLATEINGACDARQIRCGGERASMAPEFRLDYLDDMPSTGLAALRLLASFGGGTVGAARSEGSEESIAQFRAIAGLVAPGPLGGDELLLAGWVAAPECVPRPAIIDDEGTVARSDATVSGGSDVVDYLNKKGLAANAERFTLRTACREPTCRMVFEGCGWRGTGAPVATLEAGLDPRFEGAVVFFERIEGSGAVADAGFAAYPKAIARTMMAAIVRCYALLMPILATIGGIGILAAGASRREPRDHAVLLLVAGACVIAVAARCALIAYIDVTSFPAVNTQYLSPAAPFLIMAVVLGNYLGGRALLGRTARGSRC